MIVVVPVSVVLPFPSQPLFCYSRRAYPKELQHKQSILKANLAIRKKKKATLENRQKQQQVCEQREKEYQNLAGKYIYRIDDFDAGHGWLLKIQIGDEVICDRIFRDNQHGTASNALKIAQEEKKRHLNLLDMPHAEGRRFRKKLHVANTSGVNGVSPSGEEVLTLCSRTITI